MKGISGNPVLDAYHRMAVTPVSGAGPVKGPAPVDPPTPAGSQNSNAEVTISTQARDLAAGASEETAKVTDLKAKVASGQLELDPMTIAHRMLDAVSKGML